MTAFAEVVHEEWIAAPLPTVRAQFADLDHHIRAGVHRKLTLRTLPPVDGTIRYEQQVRLLGLRQRDVFERHFGSDGSMTDRSVEGFNQGGSLSFEFRPAVRVEDGRSRDGTSVSITVRLPLPPLVGGLLRLPLQAQIRKEVAAAAAEDKHDIEQRGYQPRAAAAAPAVSAEPLAA